MAQKYLDVVTEAYLDANKQYYDYLRVFQFVTDKLQRLR